MQISPVSNVQRLYGLNSLSKLQSRNSTENSKNVSFGKLVFNVAMLDKFERNKTTRFIVNNISENFFRHFLREINDNSGNQNVTITAECDCDKRECYKYPMGKISVCFCDEDGQNKSDEIANCSIELNPETQDYDMITDALSKLSDKVKEELGNGGAIEIIHKAIAPYVYNTDK